MVLEWSRMLQAAAGDAAATAEAALSAQIIAAADPVVSDPGAAPDGNRESTVEQRRRMSALSGSDSARQIRDRTDLPAAIELLRPSRRSTSGTP